MKTKYTAVLFLCLLLITPVFAYNQDYDENIFKISATVDQNDYPNLSEILSEVEDKYKEETYTDPDSNLTITYNIYLPEDYDSSQKYPLMLFIADSSLVGKDAKSSLEQGYGGVIWASESSQKDNKCIVVVPTYDEVIIDDHDGYKKSDYLEVTKKLIDNISSSYAVDTNRIYATGQSMGGMSILYLSNKYPDLFTAELFVSCQWNVDELQDIGSQKFFYVASAGDEKASQGQSEVQSLLDDKKVSYSYLGDVDATLSSSEMNSKIDSLIDEKNSINFITFKEGTVTSSDSNSKMGSSEHMSSFDHAYKIESIRNWLFSQTK